MQRPWGQRVGALQISSEEDPSFRQGHFQGIQTQLSRKQRWMGSVGREEDMGHGLATRRNVLLFPKKDSRYISSHHHKGLCLPTPSCQWRDAGGIHCCFVDEKRVSER